MENVSLTKRRKALRSCEEHLNKLTNGEFFGDFTFRGLETFRIGEIKRLALKHYSPELQETLRACIEEHKKFYEQYFGRPLDDEFLKRDTSVQNILKMYRWLGKRFSLRDYSRNP